MSKIRVRGEAIRHYILEHLDKHPADIMKVTSEHFDVTRQAVNKHLASLVHEKAIIPSGNTRSRTYRLVPLMTWRQDYTLSSGLAEDAVWRKDIEEKLGPMPSNVLDIWRYGFTEMFNNAIDHSGGTTIHVTFEKTAVSTRIIIDDNGVGIFKKIQTQLGLLDERHAVLELAKGKLTTDPTRHSGEGIFFTSRMFDDFQILSGGVYFSHQFGDKEDWILERDGGSNGTCVWMKLNNHTARTMKKVFDEYASDDDYGFNKTVVPVKLAQYGDSKLVSRSEAKRLLARVDRFKIVILDFSGIESVGQAFADEIFRVFANAHPGMKLIELNASPEVQQMIQRARSHV